MHLKGQRHEKSMVFLSYAALGLSKGRRIVLFFAILCQRVTIFKSGFTHANSACVTERAHKAVYVSPLQNSPASVTPPIRHAACPIFALP